MWIYIRICLMNACGRNFFLLLSITHVKYSSREEDLAEHFKEK